MVNTISWLHRVSCKFALHRLIPVSAAIARVSRLFSTVGKNAKKSRRRELQMRYPETIPRPGIAAAFTGSAWGILPLSNYLLVREIPSPARDHGSAPS